MRINPLFLFLILLFNFQSKAQITATDAEFEAQPIGIKDQLENVLQTQLVLPKILLRPDFDEKILVFLNIDSLGHAYNFKFDKGMNNLMRLELIRILKLLQFKRTLHQRKEEAPYFISIPLSTSAYHKYKKQKQKDIVKSKLIIDTSLFVYSKADQSPIFYKGGEEGLKNYFLEELDYPKIAIQQSIEGTVILDFVVETNGYATNIEIKKGVNGGCTEEAIRLIKHSRWQPAEKGNKLVRYKITYPITFSLINATKNQVQTIGQ